MASVVDDVEARFPSGLAGLVIFCSRLHPNVIYACSDCLLDDLACDV